MRAKFLIKDSARNVTFGIRWNKESRLLLIGGPRKFLDDMLRTVAHICDVTQLDKEFRSSKEQRIKFEVPYIAKEKRVEVMDFLKKNYIVTEVSKFGRIMG